MHSKEKNMRPGIYLSKKTIPVLVIISSVIVSCSIAMYVFMITNRTPDLMCGISITFDLTALIVVLSFLGSCLFDRAGNELESTNFSFFLFSVIRMLFYDFMIFTLDGRTTTFAVTLNFILNTLYFLVEIPMMLAFSNYLFATIPGSSKFKTVFLTSVKIYLLIIIGLSIINIWIPLIFSIENGRYVRGPVAPVLFFILTFSIFILIPFVSKQNLDRRHKFAIYFYIWLPVIFSLLQFFVSGFAFLPCGSLISTCIIYVHCHVRQNWLLQRSNAELEKQKTAIMLSQIQPHFLYNSLSSIAALCTIDPEKAKETTLNFTKYLRANLSSLSNDRNIPFEEELNHTKAYLAIEEIRFADRLHFIFDIQVSNFMIPSLTLQPIVENAVKHGICKKSGGGTVTISTRMVDGHIEITVEDDGVGFDEFQELDERQNHIGIPNVKRRLKNQANGDFKIFSTPGKGTKAIIILS